MTPPPIASQTEQVAPAAQDSPALAAAGRFAGKVALITGASDRGIGGAIAERLAQEGASVALAVRQEPKRLLRKLQRLGHGHIVTHCDVTAADDPREAVECCLDRFGRLDVVVNNAGVEFARRLEDCPADQWKALLDVNLHGAIGVTQAALPHLASPGGVIVNIASALALGGCPGFSVYSASKAGMIGLTQSLAWELAPRGIRVVAVAPGMVHTPMIHKHIEHFSPDVMAKIEASHPLGMGMPHDVAAAVAFLASGDARWITGVTLPLGYISSFALPSEPFLQ